MSDQSEVKLLGSHGSPFVCRVEMALKIKGVPYEFIEEDIFNKSPLLLQLNPIHKKIPVLVHNGNSIAESIVILEYIEDTWKHNPILPHDPLDRAVDRFWVKFMDDTCFPPLWESLWTVGEEREKAAEKASDNLKFLEKELRDRGSKFFGGDTVGFADIAACFLGLWVGLLEEAVGVKMLTEDKFPILSKWALDFADDDVSQEVMSPGFREFLVGHFRARFHVVNASKRQISIKD